MRNTVEILGVKIDKVSETEALERAKDMLTTDGVSKIYTPNPEIIMSAQKDEEFKKILNKADLCTADGIGVVYGAKMLGDPVPCRVAGFDLTCNILDYVKNTGDGVFLFGAKPGVAEIAKEKLKEKYEGINICGTNDGYFTDADIPTIIDKINESGARLILVCLGAGKQEKWINDNAEKLTTVRLAMGVGGTLDVFAGNVKRAPEIFIKLNLEWLYRLAKQPGRIGRYMALPKFVIAVSKSKKGMKK